MSVNAESVRRNLEYLFPIFIGNPRYGVTNRHLEAGVIDLHLINLLLLCIYCFSEKKETLKKLKELTCYLKYPRTQHSHLTTNNIVIFVSNLFFFPKRNKILQIKLNSFLLILGPISLHPFQRSH